MHILTKFQEQIASSFCKFSKPSWDQELAEAFCAFNQPLILDLIAKGANPNQLIEITREIAFKYIEVFRCFSDHVEACLGANLFREQLSEMSEEEKENLFDDIKKEFFYKSTHLPILLISIYLGMQEIALALCEKGACLFFQVENGLRTIETNALELAMCMNQKKLAQWLLIHTNQSLGSLPISMALGDDESGEFFELICDFRLNDLKKYLIEKHYETSLEITIEEAATLHPRLQSVLLSLN